MTAEAQRPAPSPDDILSAAVQSLIEHFDSVRIVVTTHDSEKSEIHSLGAGNLYAQLGSVGSWLDSMADPGDEEEEA